jgi:glutathione S-transferase
MSDESLMRLYWSSRSPFVRKVMVVAHETGVISRIETIRVEVASSKLSAEVMAENPLNKIPTLVPPDGPALFDSRVICEYFDSLTAGPALFPPSGPGRWVALRREALGSGIMENGVARVGESFRPAERKSEPHLTAFRTKIERALDVLESEAPQLSRDIFSIGHVSIGCALSYLDFRFEEDAWRRGRPALSEWHNVFSERPSVIATAHVNVY